MCVRMCVRVYVYVHVCKIKGVAIVENFLCTYVYVSDKPDARQAGTLIIYDGKRSELIK